MAPLITKYFNSFDGKNGNTIKPLPKQEELKLFRRWKRNKDKAALDKIILSNLKFVVKCANKFRYQTNGKAIDIEDLIQAGNEGLMHAIDGFNPSKNIKFITYAVHWVNAYIRYFIYANVSTVRVTLNNKTKALIDHKWTAFNLLNGKDIDARAQWRENFKKKHGISDKTMKVEEEKLQTVCSIFSMDKKTIISDGDSETDLHNLLTNNQLNSSYLIENRDEQDLISKRVRAALKKIPQRDRDILRARFGIDNSKRDIDIVTLQKYADDCGISRQRILQLQNRALERMKEKLSVDPIIQEILSC